MLPPATTVFKANSRTSISKVRLENSKYHYKWVHSSQKRPYLRGLVYIKPTVTLFNKGIHSYLLQRQIWYIWPPFFVLWKWLHHTTQHFKVKTDHRGIIPSLLLKIFSRFSAFRWQKLIFCVLYRYTVT